VAIKDAVAHERRLRGQVPEAHKAVMVLPMIWDTVVAASVGEVLASPQHRLVLVVPPQLLAYHRVPKTIRVVVEVHWQVGCSLLPHLVHLRRFWEPRVFVLVGGLALQLLATNLLELRGSIVTNDLRSQVNSGEMVNILSKR